MYDLELVTLLDECLCTSVLELYSHKICSHKPGISLSMGIFSARYAIFL